jgi:hypothetical protein
MTLYWGYRENKGCNQNFLFSNSIGKVENIVQFSKPHKDKKNNNIYALVGDTLDIYCLGMVKEQTPKYKGKLFIGQKVYATSKEELCIYYREAVKKHRGLIDAEMKKAEQYLTNLDSDTNLIYNRNFQYNWAKSEVERLKQIIRESESQYKHLIERIKTL